MNEKTRQAIVDYIAEIDEFVPALLAAHISERFGVTTTEAMRIIFPPRPACRAVRVV